MIAAARRLALALVFTLPVAALVMPPAPAQAQTSGAPIVHQPAGKKGKTKKTGGKKAAKKKPAGTTTG